MPKKNAVIKKVSKKLPAKEDTYKKTTYDEPEPQYDVGSYYFSFYYKHIKIDRDRIPRYQDYDLMENEYPELSAALDLYADNATFSQEGQTSNFHVLTKDNRVEAIINDIIKKTNLDINCWPLMRDLAKYGDGFDEIIISDDDLIVGVFPLSVYSMYRNVDKHGQLKEDAYIQIDPATSKELTRFKWWQVCHWRVQASRTQPYGRSVLASARKVFRQLQLIEDGMVIGRLTRALQRYVYKIDVGELPPHEADRFVRDVKRQQKKRPIINPITGAIATEYNPLSSSEDLFVAVRNGSPAGVDLLRGDANLGNIRDVEYFQNKLFSAVKIPKSWVGLEKDVSAKAIITNQDIQFARTVKMLQKAVRIGLNHIFNIGILLQNIDPSKVEYEIVFPSMKTIDVMRQWEIEKTKAEVAKLYKVDLQLLSDEFVLRRFLGLSDEEIKALGYSTKEASESEQISLLDNLYDGPSTLLEELVILKELVEMELEGERFKGLMA